MLNSTAPSPPLLALDIGNTRAHVGVVDTVRHTCLASTAFPVTEIEERLSASIKALVGKVSVPIDTTAAIAGVVQDAVSIAEKLLHQDGYAVKRLTADTPHPFALRYDAPHTLGADRIANALYATAVHPGKPVVIISAGTAIVIDYIADNTFYGGAILPGIRLQLSSLHRGTDALPDFGDSAAVEIPSLPGASTGQCMIGGVVRGAAAAVEGIVAAYGDRRKSPPLMCATGGDWPILAPLVNLSCIHVPDLTLIGTAASLSCR